MVGGKGVAGGGEDEDEREDGGEREGEGEGEGEGERKEHAEAGDGASLAKLRTFRMSGPIMRSPTGADVEELERVLEM